MIATEGDEESEEDRYKDYITSTSDRFAMKRISDLPDIEKDVPSPHVGLMRISSENGDSSSSNRPQPIHLPDFLDKEVIGEDLLSQSVLDSVLKFMELGPKDQKCTELGHMLEKCTGLGCQHQKAAHLLVTREIVTYQPSHTEVGEEKEVATFMKVKPCVCPYGPCRYVKVLNCLIPVAVKESGELCQICEDKHLKKPGGKALSQEKLKVRTRRSEREKMSLMGMSDQQRKLCSK